MYYNIVSTEKDLCVVAGTLGDKKTTYYKWGAETCFHHRFNYNIAKDLVERMLHHAQKENFPDDAPEWSATIIPCCAPHCDYSDEEAYQLNRHTTVYLDTTEPVALDNDLPILDLGEPGFMPTNDAFNLWQQQQIYDNYARYINTPITTATQRYETHTTTTGNQWFNMDGLRGRTGTLLGNVNEGIYPTGRVDYAAVRRREMENDLNFYAADERPQNALRYRAQHYLDTVQAPIRRVQR